VGAGLKEQHIRHDNALAIGLNDVARHALRLLDSACQVVETATISDAVALLKSTPFNAIFIDVLTRDLSPASPDRLRGAAPGTALVLVGPSSSLGTLDAISVGGNLSFLSMDLPPDLFASSAQRFISPRNDNRTPLDREELRVSCVVGGRPATYRAKDISNRGLSFIVRPGGELGGLVPGTNVSDVRLVDRYGTALFGPVNAVVRNCGIETDGPEPLARIGLSFEAPPPARAPHLEVVRDHLTILTAMRKALRAQAAFVVTPPDAEVGYEFHEVVVPETPDAPLRLLATPPAELRINDVVRVSFDDRGQSYSGLTSVIAVAPGHLDLVLPTAVRAYHRRSSYRVQPTADRPYSARVRCDLIGLDTVFPVYDISTSGLSVVAHQTRDLLPPGLVLDEVTLRLPGEDAPIRLKGTIRGLTPLPRSPTASETQPARCGIEVAGLTRIDHNRLCRSLLADGYPHADLAEEGEFPAVWQFMEDAGFTFHLFRDKGPSTLRVLENGFGRLFGPGRAVGFSILYRHQGKLLGHFSGIKGYSGLWYGTHLAAMKNPDVTGEWISRGLCLAMLEQFEHRPDSEYIRLPWRKDQSYPARYLGWTGRAIQSHGQSEFGEFAVLLRPNDAPVPPLDRELRLADATSDDLDAIERHFWQTCTLQRIHADDLSAAQLNLHSVGRDYGACGMFRKRVIRVARLDGQRIGFSLLERSTPAVQLTELLNSFDVFAFKDLPAEIARRARAALVSDAVSYYTLEGLPQCVGASTDPDLSPFTDVGFRVLIPAQTLTLHRNVYRQFADASEVFFSRRNELSPATKPPDLRRDREEAGAAEQSRRPHAGVGRAAEA
jgi:hypothetical protein